ncbi:MAG: Polysaccharide deacetylase [Candidatus Nomurabacteria bacterium GW2011_GWF2_35_66]|uniref:Polysaccharide deacetylase n=1 Tax=Candidatus Nomurabacteria bacterium GW2011_GWE1_35_16 TaxID=1618761 RepID=A0A0G0BBP0_9BACT|nr:MAG: Polysaccharide deacetylase [Candidatus Nomurabacteria bacterium GW2011_GWF1_34_20]KKP63557.1 MAG: Polysaccharide deacetylase [Candidatus Nomurabacteria bacterium GW2011_GWE2_34_25]KKP66749.1 MAG: Polysaccharide deacetylase [Candidatus Nomurabacteria bacterium GW2011_GWE1_35_16]KKP83849.1 MAG: Polysaccharide deacetylase [Candidatus Nomurabacteria bacterium GW2011_GWF2_35_66]HAE36362.1 xylanase deacetylase [Candidatus Nomurabacteria bacterium]
MKNKKLYIIIMSFVSIIIITYSLSLSKTEAPLLSEEIETKWKTELTDNDKYVVIGRSTIAPKNILNKSKVVLLTIDDGPSIRTREMVRILNTHNVKAIFFINGIHDKDNQGIIQQLEEEGFAIGNHTWSHINLKKEKDTNIIEKEINDNTNLIIKLTNNYPRFFRAPFGESNTYIRKLAKDQGMIFMDWSGSALDWDKSTKEKDIFISNVMSNVHSGSIILIHEHPWSVANLDALLTTLEIAGYTYVDPRNIIE